MAFLDEIWDAWVLQPGSVGDAGGAGGRIVNDTALVIPERLGLGNVADRWPDLRIIGSPKVVIEPDHSRALVDFKIPWYQHQRLCAELVGWPYTDGTGFHRHAPEQYRLWMWQLVSDPTIDTPPVPVMWCTRAEPQGLGFDATYTTQNPDRLGANYYPDPEFEFAVVTATFETLAFDAAFGPLTGDLPSYPKEANRYVKKTEESEGRFLTFATGQWSLWNGQPVGGGQQVISDVNFRSFQFWEPFQTITYEWFEVLSSAFNHDRNQRLCGKTNHALFDGYQPGTMLLLKANRKPKRTPLGQFCYQVTFEFLYVPSGVNNAQPPGPAGVAYDPVAGTYTPIYWTVIRKGTETNTQPASPYNPGDMTTLFKP
jgi:hypothetical protein